MVGQGPFPDKPAKVVYPVSGKALQLLLTRLPRWIHCAHHFLPPTFSSGLCSAQGPGIVAGEEEEYHDIVPGTQQAGVYLHQVSPAETTCACTYQVPTATNRTMPVSLQAFGSRIVHHVLSHCRHTKWGSR